MRKIIELYFIAESFTILAMLEALAVVYGVSSLIFPMFSILNLE